MTDRPTNAAFTLAKCMPTAKFPQLQAAALSAALSNLQANESLCATLRVTTLGSAGPRLAVEIDCKELNKDTTDLIASGLRLAEPAYQFTPAVRRRSEEDLSFAWSIDELISPSSHIGFHNQELRDVEATVVLEKLEHSPRAADTAGCVWRSIDDIAEALLAIDANADICMQWAAKPLPIQDANPHRRAANRVEERTGNQGLQLNLSVYSDTALPVNLLRAVGHVFYGHDEVRVQQNNYEFRNENGDASSVTIIRRQNEYNPVILPSPDCLMRSGMRRHYCAGPAELPKRGSPIGVIEGPREKRIVRIPDIERFRHIYINGMTGSGKSTMILELFRGDVMRGHGALLIDPHGDLYEDALRLIPSSRLDDLVVLDAADYRHPFPLNVLAVPGMNGPRAATFITNELLAIFNSLYDMKIAGGPMFEQWFRGATTLLLSSDLEMPCLADLARVFEDRTFRKDLLERCSDRDVVRFWKQTALRASGDVSLENFAGYVCSKVNRFVGDSNLRPILSARQPGTDFREAMDNGKIVLVNLAKGQIGAQSARFLGMVIMMRLLAATLSRADIQPDERRPFFAYVDEFQTLATESAGTFLAEARKYKVACTYASQNLAGLDSASQSNLAESVTGNCGTMIMTRLGPADANSLARTFGPDISPAEMQSLPSFHAVGSFLAREVPPTPFVFGVPKPRRAKHTKDEVMAYLGKNSPAHHPMVKKALELFPDAVLLTDEGVVRASSEAKEEPSKAA